MGDGVKSADVWVLAENPVEVSSLLPVPGKRPDHAAAWEICQVEPPTICSGSDAT